MTYLETPTTGALNPSLKPALRAHDVVCLEIWGLFGPELGITYYQLVCVATPAIIYAFLPPSARIILTVIALSSIDQALSLAVASSLPHHIFRFDSSDIHRYLSTD